jgi:HAMP domain-containing protein
MIEEINSKKGAGRSIFIKFFLLSIISTIIPIIITGILIVLSYQEVISRILTEQNREFIKESGQGLFLTLYNIKIQIGLTLFIVIILTLFSNILMTRNLIRPLRNLIKGTKEVARGNLSYLIKAETKDELGKLSNNFNTMVQQLKKAKMVSEETRASLEEKTKELQKRVADLERFHELTVGRELKMVELKKKIKELEGQIKKEKSE